MHNRVLSCHSYGNTHGYSMGLLVEYSDYQNTNNIHTHTNLITINSFTHLRNTFGKYCYIFGHEFVIMRRGFICLGFSLFLLQCYAHLTVGIVPLPCYATTLGSTAGMDYHTLQSDAPVSLAGDATALARRTKKITDTR